MVKKFDTNPLDPEFPEKVSEAKVEVKTSTLRAQSVQTRSFANPTETEEQTRKFGESEFADMNATFGTGANQPTTYAPQPLHSDNSDENKTHNIGSISLPENILTALPYIPFAYIGIIAGIIELIFIPKSEPKIRYHAAQGLAAQVGIWIVLTVLGFFSWTDIGDVAGTIFYIVTTIMLIVFAVKAWQGKPIHIESVQDLTDWLEERIKPQN